MLVLSYSMQKPPLPFLSARLSSEKTSSTELHGKRLTSYTEGVNYLFTTYSTDGIIAEAIWDLESYKQLPHVPATVGAKELYNQSLSLGMVYREQQTKSLLVKGLEHEVCENMHSHWVPNSKGATDGAGRIPWFTKKYQGQENNRHRRSQEAFCKSPVGQRCWPRHTKCYNKHISLLLASQTVEHAVNVLPTVVVHGAE